MPTLIQEKNKFYDLTTYQGYRLPMVSDTMFYCMFNNSKRKKYSAYLISQILNIPFEEVNDSLVFINNKLDLERIKDTKRCVDFLCKIGDEYIGIEMNNNPDIPSLERNISYAVDVFKRETSPGKNRYHFKKVIQININNFALEHTKKAIEHYKLRNEGGEVLTDKLEFIYVSLPIIKEKLYNKEKLTELERFLLIANEEEEELVKKLSKGCKIMKEYDSEARKVSSEEETLELYSYERKILAQKAEAIHIESEAARKEGREEGILEGKRENQIEVAKRMLKDNTSLSLIEKYTGLSLKELEQLKLH